MKIPFFKQETDYTCGAACMRMILASFGIKKSERALAKIMNSAPKTGTRNWQLPRLAEDLKLSYIVKRHANPKDVRNMIKQGFRLIVDFYDPKEDVGHYAVVEFATSSRIHLIDPWHGPGQSYSWNEFVPHWKSMVDKDIGWIFGIKKNQ